MKKQRRIKESQKAVHKIDLTLIEETKFWLQYIWVRVDGKYF
jgi:hypothetical protein